MMKIQQSLLSGEKLLALLQVMIALVIRTSESEGLILADAGQHVWNLCDSGSSPE